MSSYFEDDDLEGNNGPHRDEPSGEDLLNGADPFSEEQPLPEIPPESDPQPDQQPDEPVVQKEDESEYVEQPTEEMFALEARLREGEVPDLDPAVRAALLESDLPADSATGSGPDPTPSGPDTGGADESGEEPGEHLSLIHI